MIIPLNWKMINKEQTLLEPFVKTPWKSFTFKEIKQLSKNKSDNYVHSNLKRFVKQDLLIVQKIGNVLAYSLSNSITAINTIGFLAEHKANESHLPHKDIQKLINKIKTDFFILIVTGSYAKNKQKENSDLDVVIICDDERNPDSILSQIKLESELMIPEIHPYVFTKEQFYKMLTTNEENYGKEIVRNNLIITGGREYYSIVREAIKHGFDG